MANEWLVNGGMMNDRRLQGTFCDFEIRTKDQAFPVHRIILDSCSEYFRSMFASNLKESEKGFCEVDDETSDTVLQCVDFMYTGEMNLTNETATSVLKLAHQWLLDKAVKRCQDFLTENMNSQTCVEGRQ